IIDNRTFFYQDLTGSGVETAAHLRENGRITVLFNAFEGPPRICRLFGTGKVYEIGSPRYNELIPLEERLSGSRAAVVVDVHKVGTSCGFAIPFYKPDGERTTLQDWTDGLEAVDRKFANEQEGFEAANPLSHLEFMSSSLDAKKDIRNPRGMKEYWSQENIRSIDGLPGLQFCRELVGLPSGPVKEDQKVFHVDTEEEGLLQKLGAKLQGAAGRADETGFSGGLIFGLIIGVALSSTWMRKQV
ncbi:unnamed protein product, partial [Rhizoctonia solani]